MEHSRPHHREQRRSRSPRGDGHRADAKRHRSRSPHRHHRHQTKESQKRAATLPFNARYLHKRNYEECKALFAEYLDLQKRINLADLSDDEVRGRWKSFLGKWNRGELSTGWYDLETKQRIDERAAESQKRAVPPSKVASREQDHHQPRQAPKKQGSEDESDDDFGPAPPTHAAKSGPGIPTLDDLDYRKELMNEDRNAQRADQRYERKQDRQLQKERLDEFAPKADPGSRERQLEKKREAAASNRAFRDAKSPGAEEIGEGDLMGDDADALKKEKRLNERKKNEREIRKEEVLRARAAEREERMQQYRAKEERTMEMLRGLAAQRYGKG